MGSLWESVLWGWGSGGEGGPQEAWCRGRQGGHRQSWALTGVASEAGCPAGRLYRECLPSGGCPFSCAHVAGQVACFPDGCEEGCHCPEGTFLHGLACVQVRIQLAGSTAALPCPSLAASPQQTPWPLDDGPFPTWP